MSTEREKERARKLAQGPTKSAFKADDEALARQRARDKRDEAVNNSRTRAENPERVTHLPTAARTRKDIERELTSNGKRRKT